MKFIPRKAQAEILTYESGTLGVSAVPGSGKTHTLAMLAAKLAEAIIHSYSSLPKIGRASCRERV